VGVVAQIDKIALHVAYERGPQKVSVPVSISNELSATSLGLTLAATAVACALIKYCYLDPRQVRCSQSGCRLAGSHTQTYDTPGRQWTVGQKFTKDRGVSVSFRRRLH
jgi:hypothetical protein